MLNPETVDREEIHALINHLSDDELIAVRDFLGLLREHGRLKPDTLECVLLSQSVLRRELDTPEEDEAWRHLAEEAS